MRKFMTAAVAALSLAALASADVYGPSAPIGAIPDANPVGVNGTINAVNVANPTIVSLNSVTVNVTTLHTWVGDITLTLTAPNGDNVQLMRRPGTSGAGSAGDWLVGAYTFVASGGLAVPNTGNVGPGTYNQTSNPGSTSTPPAPDADTYAIFVGDDLNGVWTLNVSDNAGGDTGAVGTFSLDITSTPEPASLGLLALAGLAAFRRR